MPLARIRTFHPQDAKALIEQLQQQGFEVEVVGPNAEQGSPASLEIDFAICDRQQVLQRAAAIAAHLQTDIVVFPGAIPAMVHNAAELLTDPALATAPETESAVSEPVATLPTQAGEPRVEASLKAASAVNSGINSPADKSDGVRSSWLRNITTTLLNSGRQAASALRSNLRRYHEQIQLRAAEAEARRAERHALKERLRLEERQKAETLERERQKQAAEAASAHQYRLQKEEGERKKRLVEMEQARVEAQEQIAALERARLAAESQRPQPPQAHPPVEQPGKPRMRQLQWRAVLTGAVAAGFLFLAGIVVANFQPSRPFPQAMSKPSFEQEVPFGPAILHPPQGPISQPSVTENRPGTVRPKPRPDKSAAATPKQKRADRSHVRRRAPNAEEDSTADDVVVRHYSSPQRRAQDLRQQAGVKRYSDQ
jgi:hypothetical protein